jgi:hypothetical protein
LRDCSKEILNIVALGGVLAAGFGDLSNSHFYKVFQLAAWQECFSVYLVTTGTAAQALAAPRSWLPDPEGKIHGK